MLQAELRDGTLITPAILSRSKLIALKGTNKSFYCPVCKEKVILRAGDKVIAHFAHSRKANCIASGGGEGVYHEQGKLLLYKWLSRQRLTVELEAYLPEMKQRPDFLIHLNGRRIAIEYQCSRISNREIIQRTNNYKQHHIHVIWILGEKLLKRISQQMFKLDSFSQTLIHQFSPTYPLSIYYFCPKTVNLLKIQDLSFLGNNRVVGKVSISPLKKLTFIQLFKAHFISASVLKAHWMQEKKRFRLQARGKLYGKELEWQQWLYQKQLHFEKLPSIIHLPVQTAYLMKLPGWIWQSRIVFDVIAPLSIGQSFTTIRCENVLTNDRFSKDHFPLINYNSHPILEYLQILAHSGFIKQTSMKTFIKLKQITVFDQLQTAMKADEQQIEQFFTKNLIKIRAW